MVKQRTSDGGPVRVDARISAPDEDKPRRKRSRQRPIKRG